MHSSNILILRLLACLHPRIAEIPRYNSSSDIEEQVGVNYFIICVRLPLGHSHLADSIVSGIADTYLFHCKNFLPWRGTTWYNNNNNNKAFKPK
jgi:hypothetical protein